MGCEFEVQGLIFCNCFDGKFETKSFIAITNIKTHVSWSTKLTAPIACFVYGVEEQKNVD